MRAETLASQREREIERERERERGFFITKQSLEIGEMEGDGEIGDGE